MKSLFSCYYVCLKINVHGKKKGALQPSLDMFLLKIVCVEGSLCTGDSFKMKPSLQQPDKQHLPACLYDITHIFDRNQVCCSRSFLTDISVIEIRN